MHGVTGGLAFCHNFHYESSRVSPRLLETDMGTARCASRRGSDLAFTPPPQACTSFNTLPRPPFICGEHQFHSVISVITVMRLMLTVAGLGEWCEWQC